MREPCAVPIHLLRAPPARPTTIEEAFVRVRHPLLLSYPAVPACLPAGCSASEKTAPAQADVPRFHALHAAGNHAPIHTAAGDEFRKAGKGSEHPACRFQDKRPMPAGTHINAPAPTIK
jgi:hypothetical protein